MNPVQLTVIDHNKSVFNKFSTKYAAHKFLTIYQIACLILRIRHTLKRLFSSFKWKYILLPYLNEKYVFFILKITNKCNL